MPFTESQQYRTAFSLVDQTERSVQYLTGRLGALQLGTKTQHKPDILRFLLWREGSIPWRYFHFLREAADLLLVEKIGGTVRFRHLLLRDYFAELTPERIDKLAARIDRRAAT